MWNGSVGKARVSARGVVSLTRSGGGGMGNGSCMAELQQRQGRILNGMSVIVPWQVMLWAGKPDVVV